MFVEKKINTNGDTDTCFPAVLTWIMDTQRQRDSTLVAEVGPEAGDGHCAVDGHLMFFAVLCYVK